MKKFFILGLFLTISLLVFGCGKGQDLSKVELQWSYVKSPSGNCYEAGTYYFGNNGYSISGQVDEKYCK